MNKARVAVMVVGVVLPFLLQFVLGGKWTLWFAPWQPPKQWLGSIVFFILVNAIPWCGMLFFSLIYDHPASLLAPALCGFGFVVYGYLSMVGTTSPTAMGGHPDVFVGARRTWWPRRSGAGSLPHLADSTPAPKLNSLSPFINSFINSAVKRPLL